MAVFLHTRVRVSDLDNSINFYCEHLGFKVISRSERSPDGTRSLVSEYGIGEFRRRFRLGDGIDAESVGASFDGGVLTIDLPKAGPAKGRRIEIQSAD